MLTQKLAEFVINTKACRRAAGGTRRGSRRIYRHHRLRAGRLAGGTRQDHCALSSLAGRQCAGDGLGHRFGDDGDRCGVRQRCVQPCPRFRRHRTPICAAIRARRWCPRSSPRANTCTHPDAMRSAAFAVGLDVAGKLGRAFGDGHYLRGWHVTATVGTFSTTAAAGAPAWTLGRSVASCVWHRRLGGVGHRCAISVP